MSTNIGMMSHNTIASEGTEAYQIERRPLIYYRISVISDEYGRNEVATPVAMWCNDVHEPIDSYDLVDGEKIINTIPAQPLSYEMGVWDEPDNGWVVLGYDIPGMEAINWDQKAKAYGRRKAQAKKWEEENGI